MPQTIQQLLTIQFAIQAVVVILAGYGLVWGVWYVIRFLNAASSRYSKFDCLWVGGVGGIAIALIGWVGVLLAHEAGWIAANQMDEPAVITYALAAVWAVFWWVVVAFVAKER